MFAVGAEGHGRHARGVPPEGEDGLAAGVPEAHGPVLAARGEQAPVRAQRQGVDGALAAAQDPFLLLGLQVEHVDFEEPAGDGAA
jgi:hypothetical protein